MVVVQLFLVSVFLLRNLERPLFHLHAVLSFESSSSKTHISSGKAPIEVFLGLIERSESSIRADSALLLQNLVQLAG